MSQVLNLKKKKRTGFKIILTVALSVLITTLGIRAGDNFLGVKDKGLESDGPCSSEMVFVPSATGGFCIDKFEASTGEKCRNEIPENQIETRDNLDTPGCQPESVKGKTPWRFISQNQAARACAKAGKRLPTNKEWLAAALGTPDMQRGWGEDDCQVNSNWPVQPGKTGSGEKCVTPGGAFDMIGNVWEWVDGTVEEGYFQEKELPHEGFVLGVDSDAMPTETTKSKGDENYYNDFFWIKMKGVRAMARGGYWGNKDEAGQYSLYAVSEPSFAGTGIGFRCVR